MPVAEICPQEMQKILQHDPSTPLIDVRSPMEFHEVHLAGARNVPFDRLLPEELSSGQNAAADANLYFICKAGVRSQRACQKMEQAGFKKVFSVAGGTDACLAAGLLVQHGKPALNLERQVRLVAGGIVLVASILAITSNPYFAGVSAFIGAGLVFAALTNTCGMGMLLAKMPWNR